MPLNRPFAASLPAYSTPPLRSASPQQFQMPARLHRSDPAMVPTADYVLMVGGSKRRKQKDFLKGNDHHDHARASRGAWG